MLGADLAHVYSKFVGPLPLTAEEFVSAVQTYFPHIIDTKVLLNLDDVLSSIMKKGSTSLSKAFGLLCAPIAPSVTSSGLADKQRVKVEVQVDDQRFVFPGSSFTMSNNFLHESISIEGILSMN